MAETLDPSVLEQLICEHSAALELFARQWTMLPEDCVQEAFVKLAGQTPPPDQPLPWLYRVVRNRAISLRRSHERRKRRESAAAAARPQWIATGRWSAEDLAEVTAALESIDAHLREVVVARIWGGLSFEQIAAVLDISTSTAHRHYEAGLVSLRNRLKTPWTTHSISLTK